MGGNVFKIGKFFISDRVFWNCGFLFYEIFADELRGMVLGRVRRFLSKAARKLLPVAAGIIAGFYAPPIAGIVAKFVSGTVKKFGVEVDETELTGVAENMIKGASIDIVKEQLTEIIFRKEEKMIAKIEARVKASVEYALREFYSELDKSIKYLSENIDEIPKALASIGASIDEINRKMETLQSIINVKTTQIERTMRGIERKLDRYFIEITETLTKTKEMTLEELAIISRLQVHRTNKSSKYEIEYEPELYVPRLKEETTFEEFREDIEFTIEKPKNMFLILAEAGMGKTWLMAHIAQKLVEKGEIVFYLPLRMGFGQLERIFKKPLLQTLSEIETIAEKNNKIIYLFLDGLDEITSEKRSDILNLITTLKNKRTTAIILSCRTTDWIYDTRIRDKYGDIKEMIYDAEYRPTIETPTSAILEEFSDDELEASLKKYGLPQLSGELRKLAKKPYILKIIAEHYWTTGKLPDLQDPEDAEKLTWKIMERFGLVSEVVEADLFKIIDLIIEAGRREIPFRHIKPHISLESWARIRSSGIIQITRKPSAHIKLNPTLAKYILLRATKDQIKPKEYLQKIAKIYPEHAEYIAKQLGIEPTPTTKKAETIEEFIETVAKEKTPITPTPKPTTPKEEIASSPIEKALLTYSQKIGAASLGILEKETGIPKEEIDDLLELADYAVASQRKGFYYHKKHYEEATRKAINQLKTQGWIEIKATAKTLKIFPEDLTRELRNRRYETTENIAWNPQKIIEFVDTNKVISEDQIEIPAPKQKIRETLQQVAIPSEKQGIWIQKQHLQKTIEATIKQINKNGEADLIAISQTTKIPTEDIAKHIAEKGYAVIGTKATTKQKLEEQIRKILAEQGITSIQQIQQKTKAKTETIRATLEKTAYRSTRKGYYYDPEYLKQKLNKIWQQLQQEPWLTKQQITQTGILPEDTDWLLKNIAEKSPTNPQIYYKKGKIEQGQVIIEKGQLKQGIMDSRMIGAEGGEIILGKGEKDIWEEFNL